MENHSLMFYMIRSELEDAVGVENSAERFVPEKARLPRRQGRPRLHLDVLALHVGAFVLPLEEGIALHQIDRWFDFVPKHEVRQLVRGEVIHADGTDFPGGIEFFQCAPGSVVVVVRLMHEVQIQIVKSKVFHRTPEALFCTLVAGICDPQFRGDEQLLSWNTAAADRLTNCLLISVSRRRVDQPIACMNGLHNGFFTRLGIRHAEHAVTNLRHLNVIVQSCIFHKDTSLFLKSRFVSICTLQRDRKDVHYLYCKVLFKI